ncbi:unnamed protein product [Durusdinium trenchii]|uniref:Uncharacterized protein n=1 Tax=Durusdinium trenchii TaxID=1381693 RepID=A0ABP0P4U8_9DINO
MVALKAGPEEDEAQENRPRGVMNTENVVAMVLQQNSELQKEVVALRQGQAVFERKSNDAVGVGQLTYGATLCSGIGFGAAPISTGVSLEGLVGVLMNGSGQLSGVWNGPGQVGGGAAMLLDAGGNQCSVGNLWGTVPGGAGTATVEKGSGAERPQRKVKALQDRAAAYGEQLDGEVGGPGHDGDRGAVEMRTRRLPASALAALVALEAQAALAVADLAGDQVALVLVVHAWDHVAAGHGWGMVMKT